MRYIIALVALAVVAGLAWGQSQDEVFNVLTRDHAVMKLIRRVEALERQVAYLAWERRARAQVDRGMCRIPGCLVLHEPVDPERFIGPCPPWPWATPATTTTTGVER